MMMKNLLIAVLLAVFSFQGAFAAIGTDAAVQAQGIVAVIDATAPDRDAAGDVAADVAASSADEVDELNASAAVEELSDYLPVVSPPASAEYPQPAGRLPGILFLSIHLPAIKPPPRA